MARQELVEVAAADARVKLTRLSRGPPLRAAFAFFFAAAFARCA
jgi:hypothetical protein